MENSDPAPIGFADEIPLERTAERIIQAAPIPNFGLPRSGSGAPRLEGLVELIAKLQQPEAEITHLQQAGITLGGLKVEYLLLALSPEAYEAAIPLLENYFGKPFPPHITIKHLDGIKIEVKYIAISEGAVHYAGVGCPFSSAEHGVGCRHLIFGYVPDDNLMHQYQTERERAKKRNPSG